MPRPARLLARALTPEGTAAVRVAAGAVMLARPRTVPQVLGAAGQDVDWSTRMLGGREVALGAGVLLAGRGPARRGWLLAGALSDAVDAAAMARALRDGSLGRTGTTRALAAACLGGAVLAAVVQLRDPRSGPAA